jgi:DNA polymerase-3 subunit epsilon
VFLIFDTETTGLPDWRAPSDSDHQPHLVQLAMVLLDAEFRERASVSLIVKPEGWKIPDEVAKIHGITTDIAERFGVPEKSAAKLYASMLYTTGAMGVGHNVKFDLRIMRIALLRAGYTKEQLDGREVQTFCTMTTSTPIVNLPPTDKMKAAGFNKPKTPNLGECIKHFFGEDLEGAHDAMVDVRACLRLFRHLRTQPVVEPMGDVI